MLSGKVRLPDKLFFPFGFHRRQLDASSADPVPVPDIPQRHRRILNQSPHSNVLFPFFQTPPTASGVDFLIMLIILVLIIKQPHLIFKNGCSIFLSIFLPHLPERHRAGRRHIQGIYPVGHRNFYRIIAVRNGRSSQAVPLGSQNQCQLFLTHQIRIINTDRVVLQSQGCGFKAKLPRRSGLKRNTRISNSGSNGVPRARPAWPCARCR